MQSDRIGMVLELIVYYYFIFLFNIGYSPKTLSTRMPITYITLTN